MRVSYWKADMLLQFVEEALTAYMSRVFMYECLYEYIRYIDPRRSSKIRLLQRHQLGFEMPHYERMDHKSCGADNQPVVFDDTVRMHSSMGFQHISTTISYFIVYLRSKIYTIIKDFSKY